MNLQPMDPQKAARQYFNALHGGLCDRCDGLISVGDRLLRTEDHQLLCRHCGVVR